MGLPSVFTQVSFDHPKSRSDETTMKNAKDIKTFKLRVMRFTFRVHLCMSPKPSQESCLDVICSLNPGTAAVAPISLLGSVPVFEPRPRRPVSDCPAHNAQIHDRGCRCPRPLLSLPFLCPVLPSPHSPLPPQTLTSGQSVHRSSALKYSANAGTPYALDAVNVLYRSWRYKHTLAIEPLGLGSKLCSTGRSPAQARTA